MNFWVSQKPDIHFRHMIHLSKRNADGSIYALDGKEFKIHSGDGVEIRVLETIEDVKEIMQEYFSMDPSAVTLRDIL